MEEAAEAGDRPCCMSDFKSVFEQLCSSPQSEMVEQALRRTVWSEEKVLDFSQAAEVIERRMLRFHQLALVPRVQDCGD